MSASFLRGILPSASCGPVWKFPPPGVRWSRLPSALFNQLHSPHFLPSFTVGFNPVELGAHLVENSGKFGRSPPPRTRAGRSGPYIRPPPPTPASFTATAEPKAACKVKERNNCEERKDCTMLGFRAVALLAVLATTQCSADSPLSQISNPAPAQSAYLTEMMVQSSSLEPAKCSQHVLEARAKATVTQGVKPTVSLQAALLIFLGVGIFAVFIAQAFQMVSR